MHVARRILAGEMLAVFVFVSLIGPSAGASAENFSMQPMSEREIYYDGFEGPFPGTWNVSDANATKGLDFWARSANRTAAGNASVWSAGVGSRQTDTALFSDDFESGLDAGWSVSTITDDSWGLSTARASSGASSLWCAQNGV